VLAGTTAGIYVERQWVAHVEKKQAPPAPPQDVERQSSSLTFSKVEGKQVIFTVQASKSTDFKGQDISLLEDVKITVFGKNADRNDVIHTKSCKYAKSDGGIQCSGSVLMELQSAADAARALKESASIPGLIRVETSGVTFEKATGLAQTVERVKFWFPNGDGEGIGAVYSSEEGQLRLLKDARVKIQAEEIAGAQKKQNAAPVEVEVRGSSLEFGKTARRILMSGPVTAATSAQQLTAGEMTVDLDPEFRAQTMVATGGPKGELPQVVSQSANGNTALRAEKLTTNLAPQGWITTVLAEGKVEGSGPAGAMQADSGELEMWPRVNQAKLLTLRGNVHVQAHDAKNGTARNLQTNALQLVFSGGQAGQASKVQHAETLERGSMEWTDTAAGRTKLAGDKLALEFSPAGKAQQLVATGAVQTEREMKGKPLQTASAAKGVAQLEPTGDWSQMTLGGNVHLKEGDRSAESQQAIFVKSAQTAELSGQAVARDANSETRAAKITFHQDSGEIEAEGGVRSTDLSAKSSAVQLNPAPTNLSSEHMHGNSKAGRALYSGHARMWQGPSVMEADSIELLRDTHVLNAVGNVRAVFPQAPAENAATKQPTIWHVSSGTLTYWDSENRAHLEKNVVVQSVDQRMRGPLLDLYFTREGAAKTGASGTAQISRAVGTGGVVVEQGERRGSAERGVYTSSDQKFVLSGGNPTLYDPIEGTTNGRELTFYIADDTIVVDSGNGLRTLTKHRVQK
jgi:lipopolysaccharide export system protein LptA